MLDRAECQSGRLIITLPQVQEDSLELSQAQTGKLATECKKESKRDRKRERERERVREKR